MNRIAAATLFLVMGFGATCADALEQTGTISALVVEVENGDFTKPPMAQVNLSGAFATTCVNSEGKTVGVANWTVRLDTYLGMAIYTLIKDARMAGKQVKLRGSTCLEWSDRMSVANVELVN